MSEGTEIELIQAAIDRLIAGTHSEEDVRKIAATNASGKLVIASGSGAVGVGGNVSGSQVLSGNKNIIGNDNIVIQIDEDTAKILEAILNPSNRQDSQKNWLRLNTIHPSIFLLFFCISTVGTIVAWNIYQPSTKKETTKPVVILPDLRLTPYKNTKLKISINYPETWNVQENINGFESEIKFISDINSNNSINCPTELIIVVDELQDRFTLEDYRNLAIKKIENINQGVKVIDESSRVNILGGFNAYKLSYKQQEEKCNFNVVETGTVRYGKSYYLTYRATIDEFPKFLSVINTMIKSFRISE
jgi:hypothetical protein